MSEENNLLRLEDLDNFEDQGMKIRETINYQNTDGFNEEDYILVGKYEDLIFDKTGGWTKFWLIGDDIGDGEFTFYIKDDKIYLHKDDIMLEPSYQDMFKHILDIVFGSIGHNIDYSGLNK